MDISELVSMVRLSFFHTVARGMVLKPLCMPGRLMDA